MAAVVTPLDPDACAVRIVDHDRVAAARARRIPNDEAHQLTELFRLLGDPTRVQILYALVEVRELALSQGICT